MNVACNCEIRFGKMSLTPKSGGRGSKVEFLALPQDTLIQLSLDLTEIYNTPFLMKICIQRPSSGFPGQGFNNIPKCLFPY